MFSERELALDAFLEANPRPAGATTEMRATSYVFQAIATVYGAAWDFFMDWSVVSLVRQTSDSEEVITGAEGGTNPSRSRFGAARDAKKTATDLSLPRGYRLRWLERRTLIKSRWKYGAAVVLNLALRHFWIVAAVPDAREGVALGAEAWVTVAALVEVHLVLQGTWRADMLAHHAICCCFVGVTVTAYSVASAADLASWHIVWDSISRMLVSNVPLHPSGRKSFRKTDDETLEQSVQQYVLGNTSQQVSRRCSDLEGTSRS